MSVTLDKESGQVRYTREFTIVPFVLNVFPFDLDRFTIVLLSSTKSKILKPLFQLILNSYIEEDIISSPSTDGIFGIYPISKEFADRTLTDAQLKKKLAIIDISQDGQFKHLHPEVVQCPPCVPQQTANDTSKVASLTDWIRNHTFKNTLIPNTLLQTGIPGDWSKNYSHTIWLASTFDEVPKVVLDNSHLIFMTEGDQSRAYMKQRIGTDHSIGEDFIFVVSSTLKSNIQLMTLPKKRFQSA